jgi:acyl-CoA oxidase
MMIVGDSAGHLARAATIATRYSCVRKQGFKDTTAVGGANAPEHTIMDYRMQQYRVFSALALSYSMRWAAIFIKNYLDKVASAINKGDTSAADELPELHASLSGLKAWCTIIAHGHMEDLRKACGGQGFLRSSGLPDIVEHFCDPATVEGEQVIMSLQCSRFLVKSVNELKAKKEPKGSVRYLLDPPVTTLPFDSWASATPEQLVDMFRDRARRQAVRLQERFASEQAQGKSFTEATNATAIHGYKAAGCHSAFVVISHNLNALNDFVKPKDKPTYQALLNLFELTALVQIKDALADWIGIVSPDLADSLMDQIHDILDRIRPDAVGLVDSLGYGDEQLKSTLGRYDGNVYGKIALIIGMVFISFWRSLPVFVLFYFIQRGYLCRG